MLIMTGQPYKHNVTPQKKKIRFVNYSGSTNLQPWLEGHFLKNYLTHILTNFTNICRSREGVVTRAQTAFEQKQRSKSEKLPNPRPVTTLGTKNRILATSQSDSKATTAKSQTTTTKGCKVCLILN